MNKALFTVLIVLNTIICCFTFTLNMATTTSASVQSMQNNFVSTLRLTPEWTNLVADLNSYTNDANNYQTDTITMTNKIAAVSDANTKAALNALKAMIIDLKALTQDNRAVEKDLKVVVSMLSTNQ